MEKREERREKREERREKREERREKREERREKREDRIYTTTSTRDDEDGNRPYDT